MVKTKRKSFTLLQEVTVTAMFLALALVTKLLFSVTIPLFGENGLKVGLTGIFTAFPAILFGPLYGGIISALSDFLGAVLKPTGAYIPWFTVVAFVGGVLKGLLWMLVKEKNEKILKIISAVLLSVVGVIGIANIFCLRADGVDGNYFSGEPKGKLSLISRIIISRASAMKDPAGSLPKFIVLVTTALIVFAAAGLLILLLDFLLTKQTKLQTHSTFKIFAALVISGIVVTTINTELLRLFVYESWEGIAFTLLWIPRVIEEVVVCMVQACFVAVLYGVYEARIKPRFFPET